jgi:hypothetical protein
MGQSFMTSVAPSHRATVGGGAFLGDAKHPGLDIWWGVDRPGTGEIESYIEARFYLGIVAIARVIMAIMRVPLV